MKKPFFQKTVPSSALSSTKKDAKYNHNDRLVDTAALLFAELFYRQVMAERVAKQNQKKKKFDS